MNSVVERVRRELAENGTQWSDIVLHVEDVEALVALVDAVAAEARIEYGPRTMAALHAVTEERDG